MSASLVGSEMCIRDSSGGRSPPERPRAAPDMRRRSLAMGKSVPQSSWAVSYTHLTLPTICSV
eukprot:13144165-Alexandrium_andersonii.AAC.1